MRALIDLDMIVYEMAFLKDDFDNDLSWPLVKSRVDTRIENVVKKSEADEWHGYLTEGKSNFRLQVATIKPYKGNRKSEKNANYYNIRSYLEALDNVTLCKGWEADDAMSMEQWYSYMRCAQKPPEYNWGNTVICTRDKDLWMCPGWHYSWGTERCKEKPLWFQTPLEGYRCFFKQILMGDSVDNIPGLYGCGPVKAKNLLKPCNSAYDMYVVTSHYYAKYFGSYWEMFYKENAQLLWMLRTTMTTEVLDMIEDWEGQDERRVDREVETS